MTARKYRGGVYNLYSNLDLLNSDLSSLLTGKEDTTLKPSCIEQRHLEVKEMESNSSQQNLGSQHGGSYLAELPEGINTSDTGTSGFCPPQLFREYNSEFCTPSSSNLLNNL